MTDAPPSPFKVIDLAFPPAERIGARVEYYHSPSQNLYGVNVYFIGQPPGHETMDRVLRECTEVAAARDGSIDIFVDAYLLPAGATDLDDGESLDPYGADRFLCFDARRQQIGVRRNGSKRFVDDEPAAGDDDEPDDDVDSTTADMLDLAGKWVWYGFHSEDELQAQIDGDAEEGDSFDVERVKAHAAAMLEQKRAAQAGWPRVTDCDRLDQAFERLRARGLCALHYPEAGYTLQHGFTAVADEVNAEGVPPDRYIGFCFYHAQDIDRAIEGDGLLVAFGSTQSDEDEDDVRIGRMVCEALQQEGLQTEWNGTASSRICLPGLRWQRRTPD
jgi:class 3 adenylate cyclase